MKHLKTQVTNRQVARTKERTEGTNEQLDVYNNQRKKGVTKKYTMQQENKMEKYT